MNRRSMLKALGIGGAAGPLAAKAAADKAVSDLAGFRSMPHSSSGPIGLPCGEAQDTTGSSLPWKQGVLNFLAKKTITGLV